MNQKVVPAGRQGFANILVVVLVVAVAVVAGYFVLIERSAPAVTEEPQEVGVPATPAPATPENISQSNVDGCSFISNSTFRSINQYEVGLGPNGPAMGYWGITFQGNTFDWSYSDVVESGTYTCKSNVLQAKLSNRSIAVHYDGKQEILTWDGIEYKRISPPDETAGWKTYRNEEYGFEFEYPNDWIITETSGAVNLSDYDIYDPRFPRGNRDGTKIQFILLPRVRTSFTQVISNENIGGNKNQFIKTNEDESSAVYRIEKPIDGDCYYIVFSKITNQEICVFAWFKRENVDQVVSTLKLDSTP